MNSCMVFPWTFRCMHAGSRAAVSWLLFSFCLQCRAVSFYAYRWSLGDLCSFLGWASFCVVFSRRFELAVGSRYRGNFDGWGFRAGRGLGEGRGVLLEVVLLLPGFKALEGRAGRGAGLCEMCRPRGEWVALLRELCLVVAMGSTAVMGGFGAFLEGTSLPG